MPVLVLFGLPGTGKTFIGNILRDHFDFHFHDGDQDLPVEMKQLISLEQPINDEMRDNFFSALTEKTLVLSRSNHKLVIAQTFIKDKYRVMLQEKIPQAKFLLIETNDRIRKNRLAERTEPKLSLEYLEKMKKIFDTPKPPFGVITNNLDGVDDVLKQLNLLI